MAFLVIIVILVLIMIISAFNSNFKKNFAEDPGYLPYRYNGLSIHEIETTIEMLNAKLNAITQQIHDNQNLTKAQKGLKQDEEISKFEKENEVRVSSGCSFTASLKDNFIITDVSGFGEPFVESIGNHPVVLSLSVNIRNKKEHLYLR